MVKNVIVNGAVKVAVIIKLVAVEGLQVAVDLSGSGSEALPGPGNPGSAEADVRHKAPNQSRQ